MRKMIKGIIYNTKDMELLGSYSRDCLSNPDGSSIAAILSIYEEGETIIGVYYTVMKDFKEYQDLPFLDINWITDEKDLKKLSKEIMLPEEYKTIWGRDVK
jgi:hypothetical protein